MKHYLIAAALMGATAIGGFAYATQAPTTAPALKPLKGDTNGDGQISRAEFMARAQARFATLDVDKNGAISREERRDARSDRGHGHGKRDGGMLRRLDTDKDGRISRAEFAAQAATRFARMDANRDGTIDKTEMAAMAGPRGGMARGGGRGMARGDADGKGALTRAEFDRQSNARFARIDANGDGFIDAAERAAIGDAMRQGRGGARGMTPRSAPTAVPTGG